MASFLQPPLLYLRDFVQDWLWARALRDGISPYAPTPTLAGIYFGDCCPVHLPHPSPHPPLAGLLALPVSWLDLLPASIVWTSVDLGCLGLAIWLLTRQPWLVVLGITGALLAWHAVRTELVHGQFTAIQLLLLVLARRDLLAKREIRAGALIGLALAIKPILVPLALFFLLRRRAWVLLGIGASVLAVGLLSLLVLGTDNTVRYLAQLPQTGQLYQDYVLNVSIWSTGGKLFPDDPLLAGGISSAAGLLTVGGVGIVLMRARDPDLAYGAAIAAGTILNPVTWDIYALLALVPAAQVADSLRARGWPRWEFGLGLLLAAGAMLPPGLGRHTVLAIIPTLVLTAFTIYVGVLALASRRLLLSQ